MNNPPATAGELRPGDVLACGESTFAVGTLAESTLPLRREKEAIPAEQPPELAPFRVPGYERFRPLGGGSLGPRFRAVCPAPGDEVTGKRIGRPGAVRRVAGLIAETGRLQSIAGRTLLLPRAVGISEGRPYVVTSYVPAIPFDTIAAALPAAERPRFAARILRRLLFALAPLHRAGFVHGGLTPADVLLEPAAGGARVKLTDFGLARLFAGSAAVAADDLPAVGGLLRESLFGGTGGGPLPRGMDQVVRRATDPDPDLRFADADEFRRRLRPFARPR